MVGGLPLERVSRVAGPSGQDSVSVTVASACERSWRIFDFIHNKRRNRLSAEGLRTWFMYSVILGS